MGAEQAARGKQEDAAGSCAGCGRLESAVEREKRGGRDGTEMVTSSPVLGREGDTTTSVMTFFRQREVRGIWLTGGGASRPA